MPVKLYPLMFAPIYKHKIWGGRRLAEHFGRRLPAGAIGESWDVAAHPHGMSTAAAGPLAGQTLAEIALAYPEELYGSRPIPEKFPLLVKLIDAGSDLSVQVHPDDEYAAIHEPGESGKTEMWYVLYAENDAQIVCGLQPGMDPEKLRQVLAAGEIEKGLQMIPVTAGDVVDLPTGVVHALGVGIVVLEIQQNSDLVYRLHDWDRRDEQGNFRELHLKDALAVIDFHRHAGVTRAAEGTLAANAFFRAEYFCGKLPITSRQEMAIVTVVEGTTSFAWDGGRHELQAGDSILLPAVCCPFSVTVNGSIVRTTPELPGKSWDGSPQQKIECHQR